MSIKSQIERIQSNVTASLAAVAAKGVTVASDSTSDDLPTLISSISTQSGSTAVSGGQPKNLLINSDFTNPVNQRGQETYTESSGDGITYTIDRWVTDGTVTIAAPDSAETYGDIGKHIEVNGVAVQYFFTNVHDLTGNLTFAACDTDGNIYCVSTPFDAIEDIVMDESGRIGILPFLGMESSDSSDFISLVLLSSGSWRWAAVYPGAYTVDTLPPYVSKGYAAEYLECSRYYRNYVGRFTPVAFISTSIARMTVHTPVPMRITPTATLVNTDNIILNTGSGKVLAVTSASVDSMENCNIYLNLGCTASSSELYATGSTFVTNIELDAELYLE